MRIRPDHLHLADGRQAILEAIQNGHDTGGTPLGHDGLHLPGFLRVHAEKPRGSFFRRLRAKAKPLEEDPAIGKFRRELQDFFPLGFTLRRDLGLRRFGPHGHLQAAIVLREAVEPHLQIGASALLAPHHHEGDGKRRCNTKKKKKE